MRQRGFIHTFLLVAIMIAMFVGIIILAKPFGNNQLNSRGIENLSVSQTENENVKASLYLPIINDKASSQWIAYGNETYGFSFLFPADWKVDLGKNGMDLEFLHCKSCAGGFHGISIEYFKGPKQKPLEEYFIPRGSGGETYISKNPNLRVLIERSTPGAGPGQTIVIQNQATKDVVTLYCGGCVDDDSNNIVRSFDFSLDRDHADSDVSWTKYF